MPRLHATSENQYGDNCVQCFDPAETPEYRYASFSEIAIGDLWIPANPPPPNRCFRLQQTVPCTWTYAGDDWHLEYKTDIPGSTLSCYLLAADEGFDGTDPADCKFWYDNDHQVAANFKYINGFAVVSHQPPEENFSLQDFAASLGIGPDPKTYIDPTAIDSDYAVIRISRKQDATNIKILTDLTAL